MGSIFLHEKWYKVELMSNRNTLQNKAIRREQRDENRRKQIKKQLASRVRDAEFKEWANEQLENHLESRRS